MPLPLADILPDEDYRFHLTLRKGDLLEFFRSADPERLAERRRSLRESPERYAFGTADAIPLIDAFDQFATSHLNYSASPQSQVSARDQLIALGGHLEPDWVLLAPDEAGDFRVRAGVVCFPTSWAPAEKVGMTLDNVHAVVPSLNAKLGPSISQFLQKLKPGTALERSNWGLAATAELDLHPELKRPAPAQPLDPARLWLRVEDQILSPLAMTPGIVFGIKLRVVPLANLASEAPLRTGLLRALRTMPSALAAYKGLAPLRDDLIAFLVEKMTSQPIV